MQQDYHELHEIRLPDSGSHKGQNGRMLLIGGSHLFHAASLWALTVASRIVDLVHYASVPENNALIEQAKIEFRNGIVVSREDMESYIEEDDCIVIGPGMTRDSETQSLTDRLLRAHPQKQWVIDAGALQMLSLDAIPKRAILTPHHQEFSGLWKKHSSAPVETGEPELEQQVREFASGHGCIVLLKGQQDIVAEGSKLRRIAGGNAGMTKGGTGDVLAGLVGALACKNDPFTAAVCGSVINKKAGDDVFARVGVYFNATDLANQIPYTMRYLVMK